MGIFKSIGSFLWKTSIPGMVWNGVKKIWGSKDTSEDVSGVTDSIKDNISNATSKVYDGGFAGMSETAIEDVKAQIKKYVAEIQETVNSFDDGKEIDTFLKGDTNAAAREYVRSVKELMATYLNGLNQVADDLDTAYATFKEQSGEIAKTTLSDAESLRSQAANKNLD